MKLNEKQRIAGFEALISTAMTLYRLEDLARLGFVVRKEKQVLNRAIRVLKRKEKYFDEMDQAVDMDDFLSDWEDYIQTLSKVPYTHLKVVSESVKNMLADIEEIK